MPGTVTAVVQHCATADVAANMATLTHLSRGAADAGAELITWPEAFAFIGPHADKLKMVEPLPQGGPLLEECQKLAVELGAELLLGGFHESAPGNRCYNTSVHLDADGAIRALYRKIHLFDVDLADGTKLQESANTAGGDQLVVTNAPFGKLGLTICYDVRFPQVYQQLVDLGAIALTVPSAFTATTGAAHWHTLLKCRAIECQSYVIAPAQHGAHNATRTSYGHSLIVDPWGEVVAEVTEGDGFASARIDASRVDSVRRQLPSLANRRTFTNGAR